jgi:enoyl-CoA hydratase
LQQSLQICFLQQLVSNTLKQTTKTRIQLSYKLTITPTEELQMSEIVSYKQADGIATIVLNNGKANAISHEVINQLNHCLDRAEQDQAVVIITGNGGIFSAGYDLKVISKDMTAAMALVREGSMLSKRLLSFPHPVVAACNGHALAKGAFLLLSADIRVGITSPCKIGLNEVAIGITLHHVGLAIAEYRLSPNYFQRAVLCAEIFKPEEAVKAGFLDMIVADSQLTTFTRSLAVELAGLDKKAHKATKLKARAKILADLEEAISKDALSTF